MNLGDALLLMKQMRSSNKASKAPQMLLQEQQYKYTPKLGLSKNAVCAFVCSLYYNFVCD